MKNSEYRLSFLKHQLAEKKQQDKKEVIWKLSPEQVEYVQRLGYRIIPDMYRITTQPIHGIGDVKSKIVKDVHYANIRGQKQIYKKLRIEDVKELERRRISFNVLKYRIILC